MARASGLDIGLGLSDQFSGSKEEVCFGRVRCNPQAFQDDISRLAEGINATNYGNVKIARMLELKGLECHRTKMTFLTIGTKKYRKKIEEELQSCPIIFGNFECKPKSQDLYLGDMISADGLEASVEATIAPRQGKIKGEMFEMKSIMEDFWLQTIGGMAGAIDVWEMGICAKLLANCGSWVGIGKAALKQLNQLQESYLRMVYSCPLFTPIPALRALAGVWDMDHKVALEKVCLVSATLDRRQEAGGRRQEPAAAGAVVQARVLICSR